LKPEARKKPIPAINRLQPSFWAFVEPTGLDAAKNFHIERLLRERGNVEVKEGAVFSIEEKQLTDCRR
jgi:hypothetical protein